MTPPFLKTPPGADPVIAEGAFKAPPERVFQAWTTPEEVMQWFGRPPNRLASAEIDLVVGGRWRFTMEATGDETHAMIGEYLEIAPGRRLVFTWTHERRFADGRVETSPTSQVTVEFGSAPEGSTLRLEHRALSTEAARIGVGDGWRSSLGGLAALVEAAA